MDREALQRTVATAVESNHATQVAVHGLVKDIAQLLMEIREGDVTLEEVESRLSASTLDHIGDAGHTMSRTAGLLRDLRVMLEK